MNNIKNIILTTVVSVFTVLSGIVMAETFVGPSDIPENYNVAPPINESVNSQIKSGGL